MAIPLDTIGPTVNAAGIAIPTYADVLATLQDQFRSIYGSDVYLDADSQDGQWLAIIASAFNDVNAACVAVYNAYSPSTATGAGLSSVVKINGIARHIATRSTVDVVIVGQAGTIISQGIVADALGQQWALPAGVVIPPDGDITVTATAADEGAIFAPADTITRISTPVRGWQTVNNPDAATPGAPVETDGQLRLRQSQSTALASFTPLKGLVGAVSSLPGVLQVQPYENDTDVTNADGIPEHSIALVVEGGDAAAIAQTIQNKKTLGTGTFGSTTETALDSYGVPKQIRFSRPTQIPIQVVIELHPLTNYTSAIGDAARMAVVDYINALLIGADVVLTRLYLPANLYGAANSATFEIGAIKIKRPGGVLASADIPIAFDEIATAVLSDASIVII